METSFLSPSLRNLQADPEPSVVSAQSKSSTPSRYHLWSSKSPAVQSRPTFASDKLSALSAGRSSSSLSDTVMFQETVPFWHRSGSLARRRKVSVLELGSAMATVQEMPIDSSTIPVRPPLCKASTEVFGHERSSSAPGTNWRAGPFGDALTSCLTGPSPAHEEPSFTLPTPEQPNRLDAPATSGRPLSPILSAGVTSKPTLEVDTDVIQEDVEIPPEVPLKSPAAERKGAAFPSYAFHHRGSPGIERRDPIASHRSHNRNRSESSATDRGRPVRRASSSARSRTTSKANDEPAPDKWELPKGMRVADASRRMQHAEKETLYKQASARAEKFEVMNKRDVASMSRELRGLDERCDYLRKTYKSLRAGRQKLHSRMISYLKRGNTVIFSRESLLKQEEALAALDASIDKFILKLEQAEYRRLRLRQKLLEHVSAALILNTAALHDGSKTTPPRSPVKAKSPLRNERKEVESIKIYADGHVLNLFSDIEHAIGKRCEQAY